MLIQIRVILNHQTHSEFTTPACYLCVTVTCVTVTYVLQLHVLQLPMCYSYVNFTRLHDHNKLFSME